jgi:hypothetical protein
MEENIKIEELFNKIVCLLVKENLIGTCLLGSILLHEALKKRGISSKLQEGYFINNDMYYGYHIWLIINNKNYDVGLTVTNIIHGDIFKANGVISKICIDEPKNLERIDLDTKEERLQYQEMKRSYTNYLKNPNTYWKNLDKKHLRSWENLGQYK